MFNNFSTPSTTPAVQTNTDKPMPKTSRNGKVNLFANRSANPAPVTTQTPMPTTKTPVQDCVRFYTHLGFNKLTDQAIANIHNGRILKAVSKTDMDDVSAFFSFRLVSETQGAVKAELVRANGTVEPVDLQGNLAKVFGVSVDKAPTEIHIQADLWNAEGRMDADDVEIAVGEGADRARSATITIPLSAFYDRGCGEYAGKKQQVFGASRAYVEFSDEILVSNEVDSELTHAIFAPSTAKSNGLTAEQLRRRMKKAAKKAEAKAAVATATQAQEEIAEVAEIPVDTEKEALRRENAELRAEVKELKTELANTNAKLDQILAMMSANAAPVVSTTPQPVEEPTPEPEVAEPVEEPTPAPVVPNTEVAPEMHNVVAVEEGNFFDWCDDEDEDQEDGDIDFDYDD